MSKLVGSGDNITDTVELISTAKETDFVIAGDDELVDTAVKDRRGGLTPVVGTIDMTPTVSPTDRESFKEPIPNVLLVTL